MSEIIPFPGKTTRRRKRIDNLLIERLDMPQTHIDIGQATFTCASCNNAGTFNFTNAIFKSLDFYCSKCGAAYRVTNPMFSSKPGLICK